MKPFLLTLLALTMLGCTQVGVRGHYGKPLDKEATDKLVGKWTSSDESRITVSNVAGSEQLLATQSKAGEKDREVRFFATTFGQNCTLFWVNTEAEGFYTPIRAEISENAVVLFAPDEHEIKSHVKRGELFTAPEKVANLFLIEGSNLEKFLDSQLFWDLDSATPFLKVREAGAKLP